MNEVEQFYTIASRKQRSASTPKSLSALKDKDKEKQVASFKKRQQDAARREAAAAKRMQELMRQFHTILRQVINGLFACVPVVGHYIGSGFIPCLFFVL